ncbi:MAG: hypothetical protein M3355_05055 [Actinomycetota bacterium]|nr:hypothetical protein [Actinomycetota bacterium]
MIGISSKKLRAATLGAGIAAAFGLAAVTIAPASGENSRVGVPGSATITMTEDNQRPVFEGSPTVQTGERLTILNETSPSSHGPHFFSLTKPSLVPDTNSEIKACFRAERGSVCRKVFKAHEVDFEKQKIGKRVVDSGETGWDRVFNEQRKGDSWFSDEQGSDYSAKVKFSSGRTLSYFCAFHPDTMRGEITVVGAP